jgi:hypothetical protein
MTTPIEEARSHPIILSAPMVRALLDGRKTMTRRLAWREYPSLPRVIADKPRRAASPWQRVKPGDRLWVREAWKAHSTLNSLKPCDLPKSTIFYLADDGYSPSGANARPPIYMPRWASRLTLTVTAVKVERLQAIREAECIAEGAVVRARTSDIDGGKMVETDKVGIYATPRAWFRELWDELHGKGAWDADPEVVALTFTVAKRNIDAMKEAA